MLSSIKDSRGLRIKKVIKIIRCLFSSMSRKYSSVDIENYEEHIFLINMKNKPVNALGLEFMLDITNAIKELETNDNCKAVIFASDCETFSAGFQSNELLTQDVNRLKSFWGAAQNLALSILKTRLVTASAICGSCIAGGCVFPFLSDISVMSSSDNLRIGIAATRMGIAPPKMLLLPLQNLVGYRKAEYYASQSVLLKPEQAQQSGMIQNIVSESQVMQETINIIHQYLEIPESGFQANKQLFNAKILKEIDNEQFLKEELKDFSTSLLQPDIQKMIRSHFDRFSKQK